MAEETLDTDNMKEAPNQDCDCTNVQSCNAECHAKQEGNKRGFGFEKGTVSFKSLMGRFDKKLTRETSKRNCNCDEGDLCFKCILGKVFSLEPMLDQNDS